MKTIKIQIKLYELEIETFRNAGREPFSTYHLFTSKKKAKNYALRHYHGRGEFKNIEWTKDDGSLGLGWVNYRIVRPEVDE
jgi:hypothetical protein